MNQEYTEKKEVLLQSLGSGRLLLDVLLIIVSLVAIYLMISLVSFNPSDPSWSQTAWHLPIHNIGGSVGAWLADTILFIFGVMAYAISPMIIGLCWMIFRQLYLQDHINYFTVGLRLLGILALVVTTCGLAEINIDDIWYFSSGGVIGSLVSNAIVSWFGAVNGILTLVCLWAIGITLYTGWSWMAIAEKIGRIVISMLTFTRNSWCHDKAWQKSKYQEGDTEETTFSLCAAPLPDNFLMSPATAVTVMDISATKEEAQQLPIAPHDVASKSAKMVFAPISAEKIDTFPLAAPVIAAPVLSTQLSSQLSSLTQYCNQVPSVFSSPNNCDSSKMEKWQYPKHCVAPTAATDTVLASGKVKKVSTTPVMYTTFLDVVPDTDYHPQPQVEQVIGHNIPRLNPNKVKLPRCSTFASYGIKLMSQSVAGAKVQGVEPQYPLFLYNSALQHEKDTFLQEKQLRKTFQTRQKQCCNENLSDMNGKDYDKEALQLVCQHSKQHQQLYSQSRALENKEPIFNLKTSSSCNFSPMKVLLKDSESKSLFTISTTPKPKIDVPVQWQSPFLVTARSEIPVSVNKKNSRCLTTGNKSYPRLGNIPKSIRLMQDSVSHPFLMRNENPLEKSYTPFPPLNLLTPLPLEEEQVDMFRLEQMARLVEERLADYRVKAEVVGILPGPVITRFELDLAPGVKAARISNLSRDLARSLSALAVRVVEVIPGKPYVGLELPNRYRQTVYLREVLDCAKFFESPSPLSVVLGKDIAGQSVVADLAKMPHLLVAGTTGSGKSVGINAMIISMLYKATPEEVRFIMIDPKMLELSVYEGIPHLLTKVVTDMKDASNALRWSVSEMERRYRLMSALGVRNLDGYNEKLKQTEAMCRPITDPFWKSGDSIGTTPPVLEKLPYIVVMVDEFADLMMTMGKKVEELIARLAQKARAAGIHLILATQRPSVDVITGLIKANIPTRIAFTVSSKIDSRTILDQEGAESLLGMGDMLYMPPNSSILVRVHGAFVRDQEVHAVVQDWKARGCPRYIKSITAGEERKDGTTGLDINDKLDPLFNQTVSFVIEKRRVSISGVQRQFRIGYNRAARIIEQMEIQGIVSAPRHNGNRKVLLSTTPEI